jgi:hypothetical protein
MQLVMEGMQRSRGGRHGGISRAAAAAADQPFVNFAPIFRFLAAGVAMDAPALMALEEGRCSWANSTLMALAYSATVCTSSETEWDHLYAQDVNAAAGLVAQLLPRSEPPFCPGSVRDDGTPRVAPPEHMMARAAQLAGLPAALPACEEGLRVTGWAPTYVLTDQLALTWLRGSDGNDRVRGVIALSQPGLLGHGANPVLLGMLCWNHGNNSGAAVIELLKYMQGPESDSCDTDADFLLTVLAVVPWVMGLHDELRDSRLSFAMAPGQSQGVHGLVEMTQMKKEECQLVAAWVAIGALFAVQDMRGVWEAQHVAATRIAVAEALRQAVPREARGLLHPMLHHLSRLAHTMQQSFAAVHR